MMIRCILTELLVHEKSSCKKFMKNVYVSSCQHFFGTLSSNNSARKYQIAMVLWQFLISLQYIIGLCKLFLQFLLNLIYMV